MDRISSLAFLIFNETTDEEVKQAAIKLLCGVITLKQFKNMKIANDAIAGATKKFKVGDIESQKLFNFVEQYIYNYD